MASVGVLGFISFSPTYQDLELFKDGDLFNSQKFERNSRELKLFQCTGGRQEGSPS